MLLLLLSCSGKKRTETLDLSNSIPLKGVEYSNELVMANPIGMEFIGNSLFLFLAQGEDALYIVDPVSGKLKEKWGKKGGGPGEFTYAVYWGKNKKENSMYLFDLNRAVVRTYTHPTIEDCTLHPKKEMIIRPGGAAFRYATVLENGNIVVSCIYNQEKPLLVMNNQLDSLAALGDLPDEEHKTLDLRSYWGALSSYQNVFVFAMAELGYIVCYKQLEDNSITKLWEYYLEKPIYKSTQLDRKLLRRGFVDVKMSPHYIFCTYSGKKLDLTKPSTSPETIFVFNHQGDLLRNFHVDREIGKIAVSDDEKTIYAIGHDPDIHIVRYNVGDYL